MTMDIPEARNLTDVERRMLEMLRHLHDVTDELSISRDIAELCRHAVELGRQRLGFDRLAVWMYDATSQQVTGTFGTDEKGVLRDERKVQHGNWMTGMPQGLLDYSLRYHARHDTDLHDMGKVVGRGYHTLAPLWDGEKVVGFLTIDNLTTGAPISESENELLALYASTLGHLCEGIRRNEELRELERRMLTAQKHDSLGALAGGIAHEFNNLLVGVMGNAELVAGEIPTDSDAQRHIAGITTAARRAAELVRQILAYAGKGQFARGGVELNELIESMGDLLRLTIGRGARLEFDLSRDQPALIADSEQIRQAVLNLVANASEALPDGRGTITVSTGVSQMEEADLVSVAGGSPGPGEFVWVRVSDTGTGIADEHLDRVFDPFYSTRFLGRGLGLAAVRGIAQSLGGTVLVETHVGEGSTFTFLARQSAHTKPQPDAPTDERNTGGPMVLLVDDERIVLDVTPQMLTRLGYRVDTAANGEDALKIIRRNRPDVVLLDVTMPVMNGYEALRHIHKIAPGLPVIVSSGYEQEHTMEKLEESHYAGFIQKPYTRRQLQGAIEDALRASRSSEG